VSAAAPRSAAPAAANRRKRSILRHRAVSGIGVRHPTRNTRSVRARGAEGIENAIGANMRAGSSRKLSEPATGQRRGGPLGPSPASRRMGQGVGVPDVRAYSRMVRCWRSATRAGQVQHALRDRRRDAVGRLTHAAGPARKTGSRPGACRRSPTRSAADGCEHAGSPRADPLG